MLFWTFAGITSSVRRLGTYGGQVSIHSWKSSHQMVGTSIIPEALKRVDSGVSRGMGTV